jgi:SAM-dependent methyltransferase
MGLEREQRLDRRFFVATLRNLMLDKLRHDLTKLQCPPEEGMFRRFHGRLALFRPTAMLEHYWTNHWKDEGRRERLLEKSRDAELVEYEPLIDKFMPQEGLVLEAGCGLGQVVAALSKRGYRVRGIEYDRDVVEYVNGRFPDLDVVTGDVNALALPNASVTTYVSLGVVEHFVDGPIRALAEARRVLTPNGHALISVPILNRARGAHLAQLSEKDGQERGDLTFYQYYFDVNEFIELAKQAGFAVVETRGIFLESHLVNEHPIFSRLWRTRVGRSRMRAPLRRSMRQAPTWARRRYGHMVMFVFRCA